jgi:outer membrane receptor protein involved in Fe transport
VANYQIDDRRGVRFRYRKLLGTVNDFELLSPNDSFLFSPTGLPDLGLLGRGRGYDLEYRHTMHDASFFYATLFQQDLRRAGITREPAQGLAEVRTRGVQTGYEGFIGRNINYFVRLNLNDVKDRSTNDRVVSVPRWATLAGAQYLAPSGWFVEPSVAYVGRRLSGIEPRTEAGGLGLVNLRAGKRWGLRTTAYVELNNAFDKQYVTQFDLQPGRILRAGFSHRF